jgi:hypothetical protein
LNKKKYKRQTGITHTTDNERFGASGAVARPKVCGNLGVYRPSEQQWNPRLREAAGTLVAMRAQPSSSAYSKKNKVESLAQLDKLEKNDRDTSKDK